MPTSKQSFASHARWLAPYHFFASPITALYALHAIFYAIYSPSWGHAVHALWASAIAAGVVSARIMALTVQNRVIRLEMRLRLREVLPAPLVARIPELKTSQLIGLRFAGDAELPGLVERTLKGEFESTKAIKRAVTDWQPDYLRA
jgi:hypothetical protein